MAHNIPKPPTGLKRSGRALWRALLDDYELDEHERATLLQACRTADHLDALARLIESEGILSDSSQGTRVHPALVEHRQQAVTLARLLAALRIPANETEDAPSGRTQRRSGVKGVYAIGGDL